MIQKQKITANYVLFLLIAIVCISMWLLRVGPEVENVSMHEGVYDARSIDFNTICASIDGEVEYVPEELLTPEEFAVSPNIQIGTIPDDIHYATYRRRILLPNNNPLAFSCFTSGTASRIFLNGVLLTEAGHPGATKNDTVAGERFMTIWFMPTDAVLELVEQTANFAHKDGISTPEEVTIGNEGNITAVAKRGFFYLSLVIGFYILLCVVHFLLFLLLPNYRANLWLSLMCLIWAFRTGVTSQKYLLTLIPSMGWETALRIEYLAIPLTLTVIFLAYTTLFPGVMQKWFRVIVYISSAVMVGFCIFTDTLTMSQGGIVTQIAAGVAAVYMLVRLAWVVRHPNTGQKIIITGVAVALFALVFDTLYYNDVITRYVHGSIMEPALIAFSLFQLTAMLHLTMQEATAAKEAEERLSMENASLDRVNRLKSELIATISHEIRTPLTVISTYAQMADKAIQKGDYQEPALNRLNIITREADRLAALSSNILRAFKENDGTREKIPISIEGILVQTTAIFIPIMDKKKNIPDVHISPNIPLISGNLDDLTQVLFNLLINANAHTHDGTISIIGEPSKDNRFLEVKISDTGSGIPSDLLPHIFQKSVHDEKGTGYGLYICKGIIEDHQGTIAVESSFGIGTTVTIRLPVHAV